MAIKLDVTQKVIIYTGKPLQDEKKEDIFLRTILCNALMVTDEEKDAIKKLDRHLLATLIYKTDEVELSVENVADLKKLVNIAYNALIAGPVFEILDPTPVKVEVDATPKS